MWRGVCAEIFLLYLLTFINIKSTNIYRFIQVHILTRGYNDKSHALSVSVSDFGRKRVVSFGVLSVSAETEISTFGRSLIIIAAKKL